MEVNRKLRAAALVLMGTCGGAPLLGCSPQKNSEMGLNTVKFKDPVRREGVETIAILAPAQPQTWEVYQTLVNELGSDFNVVSMTMEPSTMPQQIDQKLRDVEPACLVLMDNRTLALYRDLQQSAPTRKFPPSVVLMTSFLDEVIQSLRGATGIAYEVPAVSSFVAFREISTAPIQRVGVVHRDAFAGIVASQRELAAGEKITLVAAPVADEPTVADVDEALATLIEGEGVDALWVLNDNALLSRELVAETWLPELADNPMPVVVGVSALVQSELNFGTLAVLPSHEALAAQASDLIYDLAAADWSLGSQERKVELPLSVRTVANVAQIEERFGLRQGALQKIDMAVK